MKIKVEKWVRQYKDHMDDLNELDYPDDGDIGPGYIVGAVIEQQMESGKIVKYMFLGIILDREQFKLRGDNDISDEDVEDEDRSLTIGDGLLIYFPQSAQLTGLWYGAEIKKQGMKIWREYSP